MGRLIIDGNQVYELDEACLQAKAAEEERRRRRNGTDAKPQRAGQQGRYPSHGATGRRQP